MKIASQSVLTVRAATLAGIFAAMLGQVAAAPPTSEEVTEELKKKYSEYFGI